MREKPDDDSSHGTEPVILDGRTVTPEAVVAVAREGRPVTVPAAARERVRTARARVEDVVDSGEPVYGLNTGFGELVDERIPADRIEDLQTNLLRSHAAGGGRECTREEVRAMLACRINALVTGHSGVREVVIDHLLTLLNEGVQPVVRSRGSLGASGDLAPLAQLSLVLLGEGEAICYGDGNGKRGEIENGDGNGRETENRTGNANTPPGVDESETPQRPIRVPGDVALEAVGLEPLSLAPKEGLALINGTQLTVGLAAILVIDGDRLLEAADAAGALTTEVTLGTTASSDPAIHAARPHAGQKRRAAAIRDLTADSQVVEAHRNCDRVQDAYSLRCLPQVHGAVADALEHLRAAVAVELNSATDNPLVFAADEVDERASGSDLAAVLSGGNFHGEPLALRLEYARLALTDLGAISERRIDRLLNPNLQEPHLPPFLAPESGLQSGYMIAQYAAAAALNECRSLGAAVSDNTPVSGGQEDHVSMSAQSGVNARRTLECVRRIVATELLCAGEAGEYVGDAVAAFEAGENLSCAGDEGSAADADSFDPSDVLGTGTAALYTELRTLVPPLEGDRRLDGDLDVVAAAIESGALLEAVRAAVGGKPGRDAPDT